MTGYPQEAMSSLVVTKGVLLPSIKKHRTPQMLLFSPHFYSTKHYGPSERDH
jgi:hypothetical protein